MVVKSRSMGRGPKKITPIEINVFDQEMLEDMDIGKSILIILDDELHLRGKIFNERCSECSPEDSLVFLHLKHPSIKGKDVSYLLQEEENKFQKNHKDHDKFKQEEEPKYGE